MTEVNKIGVTGYTQQKVTEIEQAVYASGKDAAIFDNDASGTYSLSEITAMEKFLELHQKTQDLKSKYDGSIFGKEDKKAAYEQAQGVENAYFELYAKEKAVQEAKKQEADKAAKAKDDKVAADLKKAQDEVQTAKAETVAAKAETEKAKAETRAAQVEAETLRKEKQDRLATEAKAKADADAKAKADADAKAKAAADAKVKADAKAKADAVNPAEAVKKSTSNNAAVQYYTVAIGNMFGKKEIDRDVQVEFIDLQGAVARTMPKREDGLYDMPAVRHLTLADIDKKIDGINEQMKSADRKQKRALNKDLTAYQNLKDFVEEHKSALTLEEEKPEEKGVIGKAASATGGAISATAKFIDNHVIRVSDARKGAKNAGKRVEAQWKTNTGRDLGVSAVLSTAGNTAGLVTSFGSGAIGTGTDAIDAGTDAVDNMEHGVTRAILKPLSGVGKVGSGVLDLGAAALDGTGDLLKNGLYINRIWKGKDNDQAIDELTRNAFANIAGNMIQASLKPDATDEEKKAYEEALKKERVEYGYIVDVKQRLGLTDAELGRMSTDEIRAKIVDSVEKETIPVALIKAFAATPIMEQGMKEQSQLLVTDGAEAAAKASRAGGKLWGGIKDVFTLGLLDDEEEVKTQSTREITQTQRDIQIAAWRADFLPKFEENKTAIIDKLAPADFIKDAVEAVLNENYDVKNLSAADVEAARAKVKRALYDQLGAQLEKNFTEFEKHRLYKRAENDGTYGKDTFWADFWNYMDDAHAQENNAGDRGFLENFKSTALSFVTAPIKAVATDAPYTIAQLAGGVPFIEHQCFFMMLFGSSEHLEGLNNILEGKYNGAQKNAGWSQQGYGLAKDWFIKWSKHHTRKIVHKEPEHHCGCKPKPDPEPPTKTPDDIFLEDPEHFVLTD